MSANDTSVRLRSFKSRIVVRIAFSAVALTAGVTIQPRRGGLFLGAVSANDTSVRLRSFKSRIVVRIAFSAVALTAGVNPQNSSLLLEFFTQRGRKPYPRKSNLTFGYFSLRRPSLQ